MAPPQLPDPESHHPWAESPSRPLSSPEEANDIDYPVSDGDPDPDDRGSEADTWHSEYRGPDEEPPQEKGEHEPEAVVGRRLEFSDVMRRFPDTGAGRRGPAAAYRPPPQYDRGSDSEGEEAVAVVVRGRRCVVCARRAVAVVYVPCGHGVCAFCGKRAWCRGRMKRFRFPRWLRCQTCVRRVAAVDVVGGGAGVGVLEWVVGASERIAALWRGRCGVMGDG